MPQKTRSRNIITQGRIPPYRSLVFFGDSITVGAFDKEGKGGWVGRLSKLFAEKGSQDYQYIFENRGRCGNTTLNTLKDVRSAAVKGMQSHLVVVNSGLNDTIIYGEGRNRCYLSHTKRMKAWSGILNVATKKEWNMLVVGLPGVRGDVVEVKDRSYRIEMQEIERYNRALKSLCDERDVSFLNVSAEWRKNKGAGMFNTDGFHPNARGHQLLARQVFKHIQKLEMI